MPFRFPAFTPIEKPNATAANKKGLTHMFSWWNSLDAVSRISTISNCLIAILGIWVFIIGRRENQLEDKEQTESNRTRDNEITTAKQSAAGAIERAAGLEKSAAESRERAAKFELALATIRAPRTVSAEQRTNLMSLMGTNAKPGEVQINFQTTDGEAGQYAKKINSVLRECGFETSFDEYGMVGFQAGGTPAGLFLIVKDPSNCAKRAEIIFSAFSKAEIPIRVAADVNFDFAAVRIHVGTKPL